MEIITKKLIDLNPADYNPRYIEDEAMTGLKASIEEFGCVQPIIWNKHTGNVVGGHQRLKVLLSQGIKETDIVVVDLPIEKEKALNVTLNNHNISGDFTAGLGLVLNDIKTDLPDIYECLNLEALLVDISEIPEPAGGGNTDPDNVPEVAEEPIIKTGDLVRLGRHRILCGDSTNKEDVERVMDGEKIAHTYSDPPYGISVVKVDQIGGSGAFGGKKNEKRGSIDGNNIIKANKYKLVKGDDSTETAQKYYEICKNNNVDNMILWGGNHYTDFLPISRGWICWDKIDGVEGTTKNFSDIELAWTSYNVPARIVRHRWQGLLKASEQKEKRCHPTQKPIALAEECMELFKFGEIVFDGFLGSGSTLLACHLTGRTCYAIEYEPCYVQVSTQRWIDFTGNPEDVIIERDGKEYGWEKLSG